NLKYSSKTTLSNINNINQNIKVKDSNDIKSKIKKKKQTSDTINNKSVPVNIPKRETCLIHPSCYEEDAEIIPPHVIVGRRREMACSVPSGNGRTLKGRDLSHVRNSILRMTGFLETRGKGVVVPWVRAKLWREIEP
ncbi:senescence regulator, partial [Tanacetum coccineum]